MKSCGPISYTLHLEFLSEKYIKNLTILTSARVSRNRKYQIILVHLREQFHRALKGSKFRSLISLGRKEHVGRAPIKMWLVPNNETNFLLNGKLFSLFY